MEVSNPRDDRAERNRGSAQHGHPEGWKLPSRTEHHIRFFFLHNNPQNLVYFKVLRVFSSWVRTPGGDAILSPRQKVWQFLSGVQEIGLLP